MALPVGSGKVPTKAAYSEKVTAKQTGVVESPTVSKTVLTI